LESAARIAGSAVLFGSLAFLWYLFWMGEPKNKEQELRRQRHP